MTMSDSQPQKILLGVTGGIAAYKSAELIRRLQDQNCVVRVVMTNSAEKFIGKITLQALSGHPVYTDMYQSEERVMEHIDLARWADLILIAPCSANFIAKLTHGLADDLLSTICLAAQNQITIAPAMNQAMWLNQATQQNIQCLNNRGIEILGPDKGDQACGETGPGRLLDISKIVEALICSSADLHQKKIIITAGPTREAIDPVRFISNHSSGKMGYALADAAQKAGADVLLISGPVNIAKPANVERQSVESAEQMLQAVMANIESCDIFIAAAAVGDYSPAKPADNKIKKTDSSLNIELKKNPDILQTVSALENRPFCVGFAAETEKLLEHAQQKLKNKNLEMIIANHVGRADNGEYMGFHSDYNELTVITPDEASTLTESSKTHLAKTIIQMIQQNYEKKHSS